MKIDYSINSFYGSFSILNGQLFYDDGLNPQTGRFRESFPYKHIGTFPTQLICPCRFWGAVRVQPTPVAQYHHAIFVSYTGSISVNLNIQSDIWDNIYAKLLYERGQIIIRRLINGDVRYTSEYGSVIVFDKYADESGHETDLQPLEDITERYYTGTVATSLNVSSVYEYQVGYFAYTGVVLCALQPSSLVVATISYTGQVQCALLPSSLVTRSWAYTGVTLTNLLPASLFNQVFVAAGVTQVILLPSSSYIAPEGYTYNGVLQIVLSPSSQVSVQYVFVGVTLVQLNTSSIVSTERVYIGAVLCQLVPSGSFSLTYQLTGTVNVNLNVASLVYLQWAYNGFTAVNLLPASGLSYSIVYTGSASINIIPIAYYAFVVFDKEYDGLFDFIINPNSVYEHEHIVLIGNFYYDIITDDNIYPMDYDVKPEPYYGNEKLLVNYLKGG